MFETSCWGSLKDKQHNENVRTRLWFEPVLQIIKKQQTQLFGHLQRMLITSLQYRAYNKVTVDFKAKWRPKRRWREYIKDTLQQQKLTIRRNKTSRKKNLQTTLLPWIREKGKNSNLLKVIRTILCRLMHNLLTFIFYMWWPSASRECTLGPDSHREDILIIRIR
jgi:hypothetical protein